MTTIELPPEDDANWWLQQEGETSEQWQARTSARSKRDSLMSNYRDYSEIIDHIRENYRTEDGDELAWEEVTDLVGSWVYDQGQQAAEEKEQELKDDYDSTAEEIASGESWVTYEPEEEEE